MKPALPQDDKHRVMIEMFIESTGEPQEGQGQALGMWYTDSGQECGHRIKQILTVGPPAAYSTSLTLRQDKSLLV